MIFFLLRIQNPNLKKKKKIGGGGGCGGGGRGGEVEGGLE